jgi:hypothetical protein
MTRAYWLMLVALLLGPALVAADAAASAAAPSAVTWSVQHTPWYTHAHGDLVDVSCPGGGFCMAIGDRGDGHEFAATRVGGKWRLVQTPGRTLDLRALDCVSGRFCMAVGSGLDSSAGHGVVLRWNGARWRFAPAPRATDGVDTGLDDVACSSASRCMAIGESGDSGYGLDLGAFAAEWTGSGWRTRFVSDPARKLFLNAVSCSSARLCVAVGNDRHSSAVMRWNGNGWRDIPAAEVPFKEPNSEASLSDVSCRARGECVALGERHRTGSGYRLMTVRRHEGRWLLDGRGRPVLPGPVVSLSCSTTGRCTALLRTGTSRTDHVLVRPRGTWLVRAVHNPAGAAVTAQLAALSCGAQFCTFVGWVGRSRVTHTRIFRYAGGVAHRVTSPTPRSNDETALHDLSCPTAAMCLAVGPNADFRPTIERYQNGKWHLPPRTAQGISPSAVSCSNARFCVATGWDGSHARFASWNGSRWRVGDVPMLGPGTTGFRSTADDVSCPSDKFCAAVGQRFRDTTSYAAAAVWRATTGWRQVPVPTSVAADSELGAISCTSAVSCLAIGRAGGDALLEQWNGHAWSLVVQRSGKWSFVSCTSTSFCMLIGSTPHGAPVDARWDGTSLHPLGHPVWGPLSCVSSTNCTLSVHDGSFRRWTGNRWVFEHGVRVGDGFLAAISCVPRACTAVGQRAGPVDLPLAARTR